jgi:hypothetical protein
MAPYAFGRTFRPGMISYGQNDKGSLQEYHKDQFPVNNGAEVPDGLEDHV